MKQKKAAKSHITEANIVVCLVTLLKMINWNKKFHQSNNNDQNHGGDVYVSDSEHDISASFGWIFQSPWFVSWLPQQHLAWRYTAVWRALAPPCVWQIAPWSFHVAGGELWAWFGSAHSSLCSAASSDGRRVLSERKAAPIRESKD